MDRRLASLELDEVRRQAVRRYVAHATEAPKTRVGPTLRRAVLVAVAASLTIVFSLSVAAAVFPGFEHLIKRLGEDLRGRVQPVEASAVAEGIRMDVLAAVRDDESAVVYVALTDDAGARIGPDTELHFVDSDDGFCWGPQVDYDPETGTAIYRVEMHGWGEERLDENVNLRVHCILTGVEHRDGIDTGLTLADVMDQNPSPALAEAGAFARNGAHIGGGYGISYGTQEESALADAIAAQIDGGTMPLLAGGSAPMAAAGVNWVDIKAAGVVDGLLHLQVAPANAGDAYAHTGFYLAWPGQAGESHANGLITADIDLMPFEGACHDGSFSALREHILELPEGADPADVRILANASVYDEHLLGPWEAAFTMDTDPDLLCARDVTVGNYTYSEITVSAIGIKGEYRGAGVVTADENGEAIAPDTGEATFTLYLKDGTEVAYDSAFGGSDMEGNLSAGVNFARPIDVAEVGRLLVNGVEVPLQPED